MEGENIDKINQRKMRNYLFQWKYFGGIHSLQLPELALSFY